MKVKLTVISLLVSLILIGSSSTETYTVPSNENSLLLSLNDIIGVKLKTWKFYQPPVFWNDTENVITPSPKTAMDVPAIATEHKKIPLPKPKKPIIKKSSWIQDNNISFYGPGFYGNRTACGLKLTTKLQGVAHRTLPCGTLVTFKYNNKIITVPVVDRGPYVYGRIWDLTGGACQALKHCFTGTIWYRIEK